MAPGAAQMSCGQKHRSLTSTYAELFLKQSPVAGLDVVCDRRPNAWRKASWIAIMIALCYLTASGWQSAIGGYFAFDVTVSLETSVNVSFGFPDVTICNSSPLSETKACPSQLEATNVTTIVTDICSKANIFNDQEFKEIADKLETDMAKLQVQGRNELQEAYFKGSATSVTICEDVQRKGSREGGFPSARRSAIPGMIGCMDGSLIAIIAPKGERKAAFMCRKGYYAENCMFHICDADMRILTMDPIRPESHRD
ncbi:hypothetical protein HPB49_026415 [Dermacentor silvarum]|nr:hypothetical protein HPB49_026415 [Dermacentor silvarum]